LLVQALDFPPLLVKPADRADPDLRIGDGRNQISVGGSADRRMIAECQGL
jgi:hypothetical protein